MPSTDGSDRYLNKFAVEVPINANDLLEGSRTFNLDLSNISNSYLIRSSSQALIKDQPAIVRLIGTKAGIEGEQDIVYELGIFKTNGVALTNATRANIVIDGIYGKGTADQLDFDMGRLPRLTIQPDMHSGQYRVQTKEDTRYESVKSVVIDFSQIYAMSDTDVHFSSSVLSCKGELYDQPALVAIESLGDFGRKNNVVSGFFKVSLLRAKDGALLTNCSGGDILIDAAIDQSTTGQLGQDFVLTNLHDLRIWGDDKSSTVNINGMVLYSPDSASRNVVVKLNGAKAVADGGKISVSPSKAISGSLSATNRFRGNEILPVTSLNRVSPGCAMYAAPREIPSAVFLRFCTMCDRGISPQAPRKPTTATPCPCNGVCISPRAKVS